MKHKFIIITTFKKEIEIEAPTRDKAREIAEEEVFYGNINGIDTDDFETEIF